MEAATERVARSSRPKGRRRWAFAAAACVAVAIGAGIGVGSYAFVYAKGASYLSNDPRACANCHVMQDHYDAWTHSSHRAVAGCNDCHTPEPFFAKYLTKASNGWHHSFAFTTGDFHEPIRIKRANHELVEAQCRRCHSEITGAVDGHRANDSCVRCHRTVGHDR